MKIVLYSEVVFDGIGDFVHLEDIYRYLKNQPRFQDAEFVIILELFGRPDDPIEHEVGGTYSGTMGIGFDRQKQIYGMGLGDDSCGIKIADVARIKPEKAWEIVTKQSPELAMQVFPYYRSTNFDSYKAATDLGLQKIAQLKELPISDSARKSFNIYFDYRLNTHKASLSSYQNS